MAKRLDPCPLACLRPPVAGGGSFVDEKSRVPGSIRTPSTESRRDTVSSENGIDDLIDRFPEGR